MYFRRKTWAGRAYLQIAERLPINQSVNHTVEDEL
jgi:hypothetical protein